MTERYLKAEKCSCKERYYLVPNLPRMRMEELRPRVVEWRRTDDSIRKATRLRELLDLVREGPGTISQCGVAHVEGRRARRGAGRGAGYSGGCNSAGRRSASAWHFCLTGSGKRVNLL